MNKETVVKALEAYDKEHGITQIRYLNDPFTAEGLKIEHEETCGGSEGSGEEHWVVIKVTDEVENNVSYWEIPGFYQSYHGAELELHNVFEVTSVEVMVTEWHKK